MAAKFKIRLTIGTKLVTLIAVLLMSSVVSLVGLSTKMFTDDTSGLIYEQNKEAARTTAGQIRSVLEKLAEKALILGTVLERDTSAPEIKQEIIKQFFVNDKDFLAVYVHDVSKPGAPSVKSRAISPDLATQGDPNGDKLITAVTGDPEYSLPYVAKGERLVLTFQYGDDPVMVISIPFLEAHSPSQGGARFSHTLTALLRRTNNSKIFKTFDNDSLKTQFMIDAKGRSFVHSDPQIRPRQALDHLGIVRHILEKGKDSDEGNIRYVTGSGKGAKALLAGYAKVGFGGLWVVAEVPEEKAYEASDNVRNLSIYLGLTILCLSFLGGYLYSGTITWPIKQLVNAAHMISEGNFKINLKPKGRDEIASLSLAFNEMARGLEERDKVKAAFGKFHNKKIAEKILSGEVKLGGEKKIATIFFSDVRGFTAMSESMQPEQVVEMLNEYMTRMVAIITAHGGVVDKYVGDAIMALWGVPIGGPEEAVQAIRACVEMRRDLNELNKLRISRGQPALKIGMGVNSGEVIAGNIGSDEKMEYTVIGDSVNLASRIESMTKEYGTDLLISKSVHDQVKDHFVIEACKTAKVKGKTTAIEVFKVRGYVDEKGQQVLIETPYSSYAAEKSDKVVHEDKHDDKHEEKSEPQAADPLKLFEQDHSVSASALLEVATPSVDSDLTPIPFPMPAPVELGADGRVTEERTIVLETPPAGDQSSPTAKNVATPPPFKGASPQVIPPPFKKPTMTVAEAIEPPPAPPTRKKAA